MIDIYIGENGAGKSRVLSEIARKKISNNETTIAIATASSDRFPRRNIYNNYHYMGPRIGRDVALQSFKESFLRNGNEHILSSIFKTLRFIKFEPVLGVLIKGRRPLSKANDFIRELEYAIDSIDSHDARAELNFLKRDLLYVIEFSGKNQNDLTYWIDEKIFTHNNRELRALATLFKNEALLKKSKIIKSLDVLFVKNNNIMSISDTSSGEKSLISATAFISSRIHSHDSKVNILVDEPENSLHPAWQSKYISNLLDLFPYSNFDLFIATHSPLIVSGSINEEGVNVNKFNGYQFETMKDVHKGIEDALIEQFGVVTPLNNALSERCIDLINNVDQKKITVNSAITLLSSYKDSSLDEQQKEFLSGVIEIIESL